MKKILRSTLPVFVLLAAVITSPQSTAKHAYTNKGYPDSIYPAGIIRNISDSELLDIVQLQTFRFFWHYAHPVSGLARERDNTVRGEYYWDYINEAYDEPNFSKNTYGPKACAMIENYRSGLIWKLFMQMPDIKNGLKKLGFESPWVK